jgi:hypothetical protein
MSEKFTCVFNKTLLAVVDQERGARTRSAYVSGVLHDALADKVRVRRMAESEAEIRAHADRHFAMFGKRLDS